MSTKLQARYNPERYPLLHQWWSELPDGKRSQSLCELLEYAIWQRYYGDREQPQSDRYQILDEVGNVVREVMREAVIEMTDYLGQWHEVARYTIGDAPSSPIKRDVDELKGVLGGAESW